MKNFITLCSIVFLKVIFAQTVEVPRHKIYEDIQPIEKFTFQKGIRIRQIFKLDSNSVIYDVATKANPTVNTIKYIYSEYNEEKQKFDARFFPIERKISQTDLYPTHFFKLYDQLYILRCNYDKGKVKIFIDKIVADKQVAMKKPIYEYDSEYRSRHSFSVNLINDQIIVSYIEESQNMYAKITNLFLSASSFTFIEQKSVIFDKELTYMGYHSGMTNDLRTIAYKNKLYLVYTYSNCMGLNDIATTMESDLEKNSSTVWLVEITNEENVEMIAITPSKSDKFLIFSKVYFLNGKPYVLVSSYCKEGLCNEIFDIDNYGEKLDEQMITLREATPETDKPDKLKYLFIKEHESISDKAGNIFILAYKSYAFKSSYSESLYSDIYITKINSQNKIVFTKVYQRSSRSNYDNEVFPDYEFDGNDLVFEDTENASLFNKDANKSDELYKSLRSKSPRIKVRVDGETGEIKRELLTE